MTWASEKVRLTGQGRGPTPQLAELYDQYGSYVYRVVLGVVKDHETAEDLTQETFLYLWNRIGGFDPERGSLPAWIGLVARSRAIDYLRSVECRFRRSATSIDAVPRNREHRRADAGLAQVERILMLEGPWRKLERRQRQTLRLAYYSGLTQAEIAQRMNRPLGTIKTWMRQGLQSLRAGLDGVAGGVREA